VVAAISELEYWKDCSVAQEPRQTRWIAGESGWNLVVGKGELNSLNPW